MIDPPSPRIEFVTLTELYLAYDTMLAHFINQDTNLRSERLYERPPRADYNLPAGTLSIMDALIDPNTGLIVAIVHYYLLADGVSIGASGKKDPKRVIFGGIDYRYRSNRQSEHE